MGDFFGIPVIEDDTIPPGLFAFKDKDKMMFFDMTGARLFAFISEPKVQINDNEITVSVRVHPQQTDKLKQMLETSS